MTAPAADAASLAVAEAYFARFVEAFATFDGERVADLFVAPGVALRKDGSLLGLPDRAAIVRYYQGALDFYRLKGCRACRCSRTEAVATGARSLLATTTWDLLRADGSTLTQWRQSYSLALGEDGPRAFASAMHAD